MDEKGFIKINRKMLKWGWYDVPATKVVFLDLLLHANWEPGEYHGVPVGVGEVVFGRKKCAKRNGLSERQVRTALDHLRESGEISTSKTTNRFTVLKIEKWTFYQGRGNKSDQQSDQQATSKRPASDHIQEIKNKKKLRIESGGTTHPKKHSRGRKQNVLLTDEEYQAIKDRYENHVKLINKVDAYLANTERTYKDHESLIYRIAENDGWPKKQKQPEARELTREEINQIRENERRLNQ